MSDWFDTPLGNFVLREERRHCVQLVPAVYYPSALQVGRPAVDFLRGIECGQRFLVVGDGEGDRDIHPRHPRSPLSGGGDGDAGDGIPVGDGDAGDGGAGRNGDDDRPPPHRIIASPSALPFAARAHDLVVLPHVLERCSEPRAALREVAQVVVPQGCLVITGFNPLSVWGAARALGGRAWPGRPLRVGRVQDWLAALGFSIAGGAMLFHRPPQQDADGARKLTALDHAGARWWPGLGAVYVIVARKVEIARTDPAAARANKWRWLPDLAQPATRNATP